jgi:hypothetical protein
VAVAEVVPLEHLSTVRARQQVLLEKATAEVLVNFLIHITTAAVVVVRVQLALIQLLQLLATAAQD